MKTLLFAAIVGVFLFAGSAAVSWFLMNQQEQIAVEKETEKELDLLDPTQNLPPVIDQVNKVEKMPVGLRPDSPITVKSVMDLSRSIRKTEQKLIAREKQIKKDKEGIKMLYEDLEREREQLTAFSTQIESKIRALRELVEQIKLENEKLDASKKLVADNKTLADSIATAPISDEIRERVKVAKKYYPTMEDAMVAKLLKQSADDGDMVFAGLMLKSLDERKGSKVLEIVEPRLAEQLLKAAGINK